MKIILFLVALFVSWLSLMGNLNHPLIGIGVTLLVWSIYGLLYRYFWRKRW
jgi:divalent metal cation (Fe/Co/Zn/Cd) transporter